MIAGRELQGTTDAALRQCTDVALRRTQHTRYTGRHTPRGILCRRSRCCATSQQCSTEYAPLLCAALHRRQSTPTQRVPSQLPASVLSFLKQLCTIVLCKACTQSKGLLASCQAAESTNQRGTLLMNLLNPYHHHTAIQQKQAK